MTESIACDIKVVRLPHGQGRSERTAQIESIFWETSSRSFAPGPERDAFRERWLGRYLDAPADEVIVALAPGDRVAGYIVGALENPTPQSRFADISYFRDQFAGLCLQFPAHLHINLHAPFRSRGIGARLIDAFAERVRLAGAPGLHAVTGRGMRNVQFYLRCGFSEQGTADWNGRQIVFLGRKLPPA